MRGFDASQDHGEVFGLPGVKWEQAGVLYTLRGEPVQVVDGKVVPIELPPEPEPAGTEMTTKELREMARVYGVEGFATMSREKLIEALGDK